MAEERDPSVSVKVRHEGQLILTEGMIDDADADPTCIMLTQRKEYPSSLRAKIAPVLSFTFDSRCIVPDLSDKFGWICTEVMDLDEATDGQDTYLSPPSPEPEASEREPRSFPPNPPARPSDGIHQFLDFERSLFERRLYRSTAMISDVLGEAAEEMGGTFDLQPFDPKEETVDVYHASNFALNASDPKAIESVQKELRLPQPLPGDFLAFWRRWERAVLVLRSDYWLLSPAQMIEINTNYAQYSPRCSGHNGGQHRLIRFAEIGEGSGDYAALRLQPGKSEWDVCYIGHEYWTESAELDLDNEKWGTDPNFTAWLDRLLKTDGWPTLPWLDDPCMNIRLA
jgi:hypothetical protein